MLLLWWKKTLSRQTSRGGKHTNDTDLWVSFSAHSWEEGQCHVWLVRSSLIFPSVDWLIARTDQEGSNADLIGVDRRWQAPVWLPAACWVQLWGRGCVDTAGLIQAVFGCYCRRNWMKKKKKRVWTWWLQRRGRLLLPENTEGTWGRSGHWNQYIEAKSNTSNITGETSYCAVVLLSLL